MPGTQPSVPGMIFLVPAGWLSPLIPATRLRSIRARAGSSAPKREGGTPESSIFAVWVPACPGTRGMDHPHNCLLAMAAPSLSDLNFAHTMLGWISFEPAKVAKPQSVPAITFSRPTTLA